MRLPDRRFSVALLRRALRFWIGLRLLLLVGFLGVVEARRRNEHLLQASFGVPESVLAGLSLIPAIAADRRMAAEPSLRPELVAECIGNRFGGRAVLSAATLRVVPGSVTALVGRNWVGRSTLWCTDGTTYDPGSLVAAAEDWRFSQGFLASTLW